MDEKLVNQILENMGRMETDELLKIWETNNKEEYSEEAFEAVRRLLEDRAESLPVQKSAKPNTNKNSSQAATTVFKSFFSTKKLSIGWSCLWRGLLIYVVIVIIIEGISRLLPVSLVFNHLFLMIAKLVAFLVSVMIFSWAGKKAVERHFMLKVSAYDCKNVPLVMWLAGIIYVFIPEMFPGRYQDTVGILLAVILLVTLIFAVGNIIERVAKKHHTVNLLNK